MGEVLQSTGLEGLLQNITIVDVITFAIIIFVICFLIKKVVGLALGVLAIFVLFQVGFMVTGTDVQDKTNLENYVEPTVMEKVVSFFNDFEARRNENALVDADAVYDDMLSTADKAVEGLKSVLTEENFNKLSDSISSALIDAGVKDISLDELTKILAEKLETSLEDPMVMEMANSIKDEIMNLEVQAP